MITLFAMPDFSGFLICVINGSGLSFDQVSHLSEFIPHHLTALPVYMCLDFQASYNFQRQKQLTCVSLWQWPLGLALQIMVIFEVPFTFTSTIDSN